MHPLFIPADCRDGFLYAFWKRPRAYLDPAVRAGISSFAAANPGSYADGLARLSADLESGRWDERNAGLADEQALDLGYRLVVTQ